MSLPYPLAHTKRLQLFHIFEIETTSAAESKKKYPEELGQCPQVGARDKCEIKLKFIYASDNVCVRRTHVESSVHI